MTTAAVKLWGTRVGAVTYEAARELAFFEYDPAYLPSGIQLAPLTMPLGSAVYSFPGLARECYHALPGMLADSLPDRFGNAVIDAWLASRGRTPDSLDPVERLCYVGSRGMGALEFEPALSDGPAPSGRLDVAALAELAGQVLSDRAAFVARLAREDDEDASSMRDMLRVGTSAGGARAKAVIGWNPDSGEVRSGQVELAPGFSHWILKFDGVGGEGGNFGRIEYAYHLMAKSAGIDMSECRLLHEGSRSHFVTRRFDRTDGGAKLHMQTLCALAHLDFNQPGAHSYEQAMQIMRQIGLPAASLEQQFRRMVFNLLARNQDDHTKNIAFLMTKSGAWSLSPAYDLTYSHNPDGVWTNRHQLSLNGKREDFTFEDIDACAKGLSLRRSLAREVVDELASVVAHWPEFAAEAGVPDERAAEIGREYRSLDEPR